MVAMKGDNCVAIATDKRLGIQAQTISMDFQKVFEMGPHLYIGLPGLATDTQTVMEKLRYRCGTFSFSFHNIAHNEDIKYRHLQKKHVRVEREQEDIAESVQRDGLAHAVRETFRSVLRRTHHSGFRLKDDGTVRL